MPVIRPENLNLAPINLDFWRYYDGLLSRAQFSPKKFFSSDTGLTTFLFIIGHKEQPEGGEHMSASDRHQRLLEVLCLRRHDTYDNLAHEFNVCKRTIRYDTTL